MLRLYTCVYTQIIVYYAVSVVDDQVTPVSVIASLYSRIL